MTAVVTGWPTTGLGVVEVIDGRGCGVSGFGGDAGRGAGPGVTGGGVGDHGHGVRGAVGQPGDRAGRGTAWWCMSRPRARRWRCTRSQLPLPNVGAVQDTAALASPGVAMTPAGGGVPARTGTELLVVLPSPSSP